MEVRAIATGSQLETVTVNGTAAAALRRNFNSPTTRNRTVPGRQCVYWPPACLMSRPWHLPEPA